MRHFHKSSDGIEYTFAVNHLGHCIKQLTFLSSDFFERRFCFIHSSINQFTFERFEEMSFISNRHRFVKTSRFFCSTGKTVEFQMEPRSDQRVS